MGLWGLSHYPLLIYAKRRWRIDIYVITRDCGRNLNNFYSFHNKIHYHGKIFFSMVNGFPIFAICCHFECVQVQVYFCLPLQKPAKRSVRSWRFFLRWGIWYNFYNNGFYVILRAILCKNRAKYWLSDSAILKILVPFNMLSPIRYKSDVQSSFGWFWKLPKICHLKDWFKVWNKCGNI